MICSLASLQNLDVLMGYYCCNVWSCGSGNINRKYLPPNLNVSAMHKMFGADKALIINISKNLFMILT
jgi:hypothetical protein